MADGGGGTNSYDIRQIAEAMSLHKRSVEMRASKDGWPFTEQAVRGGRRRLYDTRHLPLDVQTAVSRSTAIAAAESIAVTAEFQAGAQLGRRLEIAGSVNSAVERRSCERGNATAAGLTGKRKARMDAKLQLLQRLGAFAHARNLKLCAAMTDFCDAYRSGELTLPDSVREHVGEDLHPATLRRWRRLLRTQGPASLAGAYGNRAGAGKIDTNHALLAFVTGLIADKPHISAKLIYEAIDARFGGDAGVELPSLRTVQAWLSKWKTSNAELLMAVTNPDGWKNKYMAAFGSQSEGIDRACQLWMLDSTPADLMLVDGRYSLVGVIDVATRLVRLNVARTSNAEAVCQITRRAIIEWGVPEAVKIDNGKDYASNRFASLLTGLEIEPRFSMPFAGWEKAFIERVFRSFSHSLLELLPGYIGHNVVDAQAIRSRQSFADRLYKKNEVVEVKLTADELQDFCDRWCRDYYAHELHSGINETPFQRFAGLRNVVRRIGDVRALDLLLGESVNRKIGKKGLRIGNLLYVAPELTAEGVMGNEVQVRVDDADIGRAVVYHQEQFLCVAECPEVTGVSLREVAIETRIQQTSRVQHAKKELKAASKKAGIREIAHEILAAKAKKNAPLTSLPAPNVVHMTSALSSASEAADALEANAAPAGEFTAADVAALGDLVRDEVAADDTARGRFVRALNALIKPEGDRTDIDRQFLKGYQLSSEYRGNWMLFEEFGAGTFGLGSEFHALLPADAPYFTNNQGAI